MSSPSSDRNTKKRKHKGRMDFVLDEFEPVPGKKNLYKFSMRPDPRIWEVIEHNGEEAWYNKIDRVLIPMEEFKKAVKTMKGIPIVTSHIEVEGIQDYIKKSSNRVKKDISEMDE